MKNKLLRSCTLFFIILALVLVLSLTVFASAPGGSGDTSGGFGSDDIPNDTPIDSDYELPYPVLPPDTEAKTFMFTQNIPVSFGVGDFSLNISGQVALNTVSAGGEYHTINFDKISFYSGYHWGSNLERAIAFEYYDNNVLYSYPVYEYWSCVFTVYGGTDIENELFLDLLEASFIDISHIIQSNEYYYQVGANDGYYMGYSQASTKQYGQNMLLSIITAPYNVLDSFTLFEANGVNISLWNVLITCIGIAMFIWFIKMFAGG